MGVLAGDQQPVTDDVNRPVGRRTPLELVRRNLILSPVGEKSPENSETR